MMSEQWASMYSWESGPIKVPRGRVVTEMHRSVLLDANKLLMIISAYWNEKTRAILEALHLEGILK